MGLRFIKVLSDFQPKLSTPFSEDVDQVINVAQRSCFGLSVGHGTTWLIHRGSRRYCIYQKTNEPGQPLSELECNRKNQKVSEHFLSIFFHLSVHAHVPVSSSPFSLNTTEEGFASASLATTSFYGSSSRPPTSTPPGSPTNPAAMYNNPPSSTFTRFATAARSLQMQQRPTAGFPLEPSQQPGPSLWQRLNQARAPTAPPYPQDPAAAFPGGIPTRRAPAPPAMGPPLFRGPPAAAVASFVGTAAPQQPLRTASEPPPPSGRLSPDAGSLSLSVTDAPPITDAEGDLASLRSWPAQPPPTVPPYPTGIAGPAPSLAAASPRTSGGTMPGATSGVVSVSPSPRTPGAKGAVAAPRRPARPEVGGPSLQPGGDVDGASPMLLPAQPPAGGPPGSPVGSPAVLQHKVSSTRVQLQQMSMGMGMGSEPTSAAPFPAMMSSGPPGPPSYTSPPPPQPPAPLPPQPSSFPAEEDTRSIHTGGQTDSGLVRSRRAHPPAGSFSDDNAAHGTHTHRHRRQPPRDGEAPPQAWDMMDTGAQGQDYRGAEGGEQPYPRSTSPQPGLPRQAPAPSEPPAPASVITSEQQQQQEAQMDNGSMSALSQPEEAAPQPAPAPRSSARRSGRPSGAARGPVGRLSSPPRLPHARSLLTRAAAVAAGDASTGEEDEGLDDDLDDGRASGSGSEDADYAADAEQAPYVQAAAAGVPPRARVPRGGEEAGEGTEEYPWLAGAEGDPTRAGDEAAGVGNEVMDDAEPGVAPESIPEEQLEFWGIPHSVARRYALRNIHGGWRYVVTRPTILLWMHLMCRLPCRVSSGCSTDGRQGVTRLYEWQIDCLRQRGVLQSSNLVYSAPTGGGKTLVAEILLTRMAQLARKRCLFILPFVSVVAEKVAHLKNVLRPLQLRIISLAGSQKCGKRQTEADVIVCTIEKANSLVNRLLLEGRIGELGLVIVDEAHMVGDRDRGCLLEQLLTKIRYSLSDVQIVALSATMPGIGTLARWLDAQLYISTFRPVPLECFIAQSGLIFNAPEGSLARTLAPPAPPPPLEMRQAHPHLAAVTAPPAAMFNIPLPTPARGGISGPYGRGPVLGGQPLPGQQGQQGAQLPVPQQGLAGAMALGAAPTGMVQAPRMPDKDPEGLLLLCREVCVHGQGVLIFCPSKSRCELCATNLARLLLETAPPPPPAPRGTATVAAPVPTIEGDVAPAGLQSDNGPSLALRRQELCAQLSRLPTGLDPALGETIPHGIAFHHAGLTVEERDLVEKGFREGVILVLCATSTLAAGVNLPGQSHNCHPAAGPPSVKGMPPLKCLHRPSCRSFPGVVATARRVIFRQPTQGPTGLLDPIQFRQMAGRAGRPGLDEKGEAYLMCTNDRERGQLLDVTRQELPEMSSRLAPDKQGMKRVMLEAIASGIVRSGHDIDRFVRCTLLERQCEHKVVKEATMEALKFLAQNEFLTWDKKAQEYLPSKLGMAALAAALGPEEALAVYGDLNVAMQGIVLEDDLHAVYLATPVYHGIEPKWRRRKRANRAYKAYCVLRQFSHSVRRLGPIKSLVAKRVGINEDFLNVCSYNDREVANLMKTDPKAYDRYRRFYAAMILCDLMHEEPIYRVESAYSVQRGQVQQLMTLAQTFCGMVVQFCRHLGWTSMAVIIKQLGPRLGFGVRADIVPLMKIRGLNSAPFRARALFQEGYRTVASVAAAHPTAIAGIFQSLRPFKKRDGEADSYVCAKHWHFGTGTLALALWHWHFGTGTLALGLARARALARTQERDTALATSFGPWHAGHRGRVHGHSQLTTHAHVKPSDSWHTDRGGGCLAMAQSAYYARMEERTAQQVVASARQLILEQTAALRSTVRLLEHVQTHLPDASDPLVPPSERVALLGPPGTPRQQPLASRMAADYTTLSPFAHVFQARMGVVGPVRRGPMLVSRGPDTSGGLPSEGDRNPTVPFEATEGPDGWGVASLGELLGTDPAAKPLAPRGTFQMLLLRTKPHLQQALRIMRTVPILAVSFAFRDPALANPMPSFALKRIAPGATPPATDGSDPQAHIHLPASANLTPQAEAGFSSALWSLTTHPGPTDHLALHEMAYLLVAWDPRLVCVIDLSLLAPDEPFDPHAAGAPDSIKAAAAKGRAPGAGGAELEASAPPTPSLGPLLLMRGDNVDGTDPTCF
ncbi:putative DNA polymerase theta [Paratrimastix pyriformis]|uniref:DNA polymerase theta n=1 Tax=Paratrimastix pyriformis TaxID=342808 RepID=A0ABQ8UJX0_9EUKA|nr:putative DNA polymerase theta [Paratrimastix pyriformis]